MTMQRAYSVFEVKELDEDKRILTGIATTPSTDRMEDIVEPKGAQFKLPLPMLFQHRHSEPIGHVTNAVVKSDGIHVTIQIAKIDEPGRLKDRIDEAWQSIKYGLVRGLSIGFDPIESAQIEGTWGRRFTKWEWLELSAVTVAANAEASIQSIKSIDSAARAASGTAGGEVSKKPGVPGKSVVTTRIERSRTMARKTIGEQIADFEATRARKAAEMETIMAKSAANGDTLTTLSAEDSDAYDNLASEIETIDEHVKRLKTLEKAQATGARPAIDVVKGVTAAPVGADRGQITLKQADKTDAGIGFARLARVKALAHLGLVNGIRDELSVAKAVYPHDENLITGIQKANVNAANTLTGNGTWAGNLVNEGGVAFADFVEYLRPRTLLGQISDRLRRIPFDTPVLVQGSGGSGGWVKEGAAKPLTKWTYTRTKLTPLKVAAIAVATKETLMRASIAADTLLRDELAKAIGATIDTTFISDTAAVTDTSPAGILDSVAALTLSGGTTVADIRCDIATFLTAMADAELSLSGVFWVMPERVAIALSLIANEVGAQAFPGITPNGGTFAGLPVFVTGYADTDSTGSVVALMKGDEIFLGDEGGIQVSMSDQASLLMTDDAYANMNSTTPTGAQVVSMFQTNSVAFLVERFLNFQRRRAQAVAWARVNWTACTGS